MKTKIIPKETNFQKWLNDYKIYCHSEDIVISKIYEGYAEIDGDITHSRCKPIYYDAEERTLLAVDIDCGAYFAISGSMYVYQNVIYYESCRSYLRKRLSLYEFVNKAIDEIQIDKRLIKKDVLVNHFLSKLSPKIAGYFRYLFEIIADAYLGGWITD